MQSFGKIGFHSSISKPYEINLTQWAPIAHTRSILNLSFFQNGRRHTDLTFSLFPVRVHTHTVNGQYNTHICTFATSGFSNRISSPVSLNFIIYIPLSPLRCALIISIEIQAHCHMK